MRLAVQERRRAGEKGTMLQGTLAEEERTCTEYSNSKNRMMGGHELGQQKRNRLFIISRPENVQDKVKGMM